MASMDEDSRHHAAEFLKDRFAAGDIGADQLEVSIAGLLAARTEADLVELVRSLPQPFPIVSPERQLADPLKIRSGVGRLRLTGRWQVARETHISAEVGNVRIDLTDAEFDDHVIDLHVYTGCGRITIIVPRGFAVQIIQHRGGVRSHLDRPVPGLPLIRLDVTTNIGTVHLRHPQSR
jgi:hypothetical protein